MIKRICAVLPLVCLLFCATPSFARDDETGASPSPTAIKSDLNHILSSPEFQSESQGDGLLTRFYHWLDDEWEGFKKFLRKLFGHALPGGYGRSGVVIIWLFVGLFILFGAWLLSKLLSYYYGGASARGTTRAKAYTQEEYEAEIVTEPDAWISEAERRAAEGDYRRAFRAVFLAVIHQMDRAGAIHFERSRTNGEYARMLRGGKFTTLVEPFGVFGAAFDLRWYGDRPATREDYERSLDTYRRLRALLAQTPQTASVTAPGPLAVGRS